MELLSCLAILMILSTISYPIYENYLSRAYRLQAEIHLLKLAQDLEYYQAEHGSYLGFKEIPLSQHYEIRIKEATEDEYHLEALPQKQQAKRDKNCGTLSLHNKGKREISGKGALRECWP